MAKFRKIEFTMGRGNGYGQYIIRAKYKGVNVAVNTNDSEAWDYFDDDSNKRKQKDALRHCYYKICQEYKRIKELQ